MFYWMIKGLLKPLLRAMYRIRVEGVANVPATGPAIIAANHRSFLDSVFIPLVVRRRRVTYLAKADYFKSWKTAWFFKAIGQISTERDGGRRSQESLEIALDVLREGKLLGIYPEGTRSPDGYLHRGRTGVARLTLAAGVPVIPCAVIGTEEVMPKAAKMPRLGGRLKIEVRFGKPLDFSSYEGKESDRLILRSVTDEIMREIMRLSGQEYKDEYASSATVPLPESHRTDGSQEAALSDETLAG